MVWYVSSKQGSDTHDGRGATTAFKTLSHAITAAKAGDTVVIEPGAYDQNLPEQVSRARAANINVTVAGAH